MNKIPDIDVNTSINTDVLAMRVFSLTEEILNIIKENVLCQTSIEELSQLLGAVQSDTVSTMSVEMARLKAENRDLKYLYNESVLNQNENIEAYSRYESALLKASSVIQEVREILDISKEEITDAVMSVKDPLAYAKKRESLEMILAEGGINSMLTEIKRRGYGWQLFSAGNVCECMLYDKGKVNARTTANTPTEAVAEALRRVVDYDG